MALLTEQMPQANNAGSVIDCASIVVDHVFVLNFCLFAVVAQSQNELLIALRHCSANKSKVIIMQEGRFAGKIGKKRLTTNKTSMISGAILHVCPLDFYSCRLPDNSKK